MILKLKLNLECTEGWHRSLGKIIESANFLLKDSLDLIIKRTKNNFLIKKSFGDFFWHFPQGSQKWSWKISENWTNCCLTQHSCSSGVIQLTVKIKHVFKSWMSGLSTGYKKIIFYLLLLQFFKLLFFKFK
jgi:ABC-type bacteriocin/lantibiotic exporter with double-glycine peptidase domain